MLRAHHDIGWLYRAPDTGLLANPIDFYGVLNDGAGTALLVECKALKGEYLSYSRFSPHQWHALCKCWRTSATTLVLFNHYGWDRSRDAARGRAYVVPFGDMYQFREVWKHERRSWPLAFFEQYPQLDKVSDTWKNLRLLM